VLDHTALVGALHSGRVRGAALDVLDNEKLNTLTPSQQANFDFLRQAPTVVLTPHVGGWTHESYRRINEVLVEKIRAFRAGELGGVAGS
jgi:D-3-phosphoglycerate dehydrogenase